MQLEVSKDLIDRLNYLSVTKSLTPNKDIDFDSPPDIEKFWMPEELTTLYGHHVYGEITNKQRCLLSQLEFSVICSVSCYGEKEVISNVAKIFLKKKFRSVRSYLHHLIREENYHIEIFAEFCQRYGTFYPILYSYVRGDIWNNSDIDDFLVFLHVLVFEELGDNLNRIMANDDTLPTIVRQINQYHHADEGRHVSFGRSLIKNLAQNLVSQLEKSELIKLQKHVEEYLNTRHIDYHNVKVYNAIGLSNAFEIREQLIKERNIDFFSRGDNIAKKKIKNLLEFLAGCQLIHLEHFQME